MAEAVPITSDSPRLEGVLGPLTPDDERTAREAVMSASQRLVELARILGGRVGWHGAGLELVWAPSGQLSIGCAVEALDSDGHAAAFFVELRPGWYYGQAQERARWLVDLRIEVDCQHRIDHEVMEAVFEVEHEATSALDAISALVKAADQLVELASGSPLQHWTAQARD